MAKIAKAKPTTDPADQSRIAAMADEADRLAKLSGGLHSTFERDGVRYWLSYPVGTCVWNILKAHDREFKR